MFDLTPLWEIAHDALRRREAPPARGEVKQLLPLGGYLSEDDWLLFQVAASHVETHHREVFNLYLTEDFVAGLLVSFLVERESVPSWDEAVDFLKEQAEENDAWLVSVPVANLDVRGASVALSDDAMLAQARNQRDWALEDQDPSRDAVREHFGDRMPLHPRWYPAIGEERMDTRNGAAFLFVEQATQELAVSVARSRARYALAAWCVLKPPTHAEVWPSVGSWAPQPWLRFEGDQKPYRPSDGPGTTGPRSSLYIYQAYPAPEDDNIVRAPFDAMALAAERRCARALLSASWALYLSNRRPSELEVTERLVCTRNRRHESLRPRWRPCKRRRCVRALDARGRQCRRVGRP
jgi:hypothetical protein